ncbi:hypothetical protein LTSEGIV_3317, partial [Salmonella enterica subsp. enterica serovar Give str. S5-487]
MFGQKFVTTMAGEQFLSHELLKTLHLLTDRRLSTTYRRRRRG